jgi:hypothetical protein
MQILFVIAVLDVLESQGVGGEQSVICSIHFTSVCKIKLYILERSGHLVEEEFMESLWKNKIFSPP